jgi:hypothetical protein
MSNDQNGTAQQSGNAQPATANAVPAASGNVVPFTNPGVASYNEIMAQEEAQGIAAGVPAKYNLADFRPHEFAHDYADFKIVEAFAADKEGAAAMQLGRDQFVPFIRDFRSQLSRAADWESFEGSIIDVAVTKYGMNSMARINAGFRWLYKNRQQFGL